MSETEKTNKGRQGLPPILAAQRCVVCRHQASTCRLCVEACPCGALAVETRSVLVDAALCTGCGACAAVCPTDALILRSPDDHALARAIREKVPEKRVHFMCSLAQADPSAGGSVRIPCLLRLNAGWLLWAAAGGIRRFDFTVGSCAHCTTPGCRGRFDETLRAVEKGAESAGIRLSLQVEEKSKMLDASKRRFFSGWVRRAEAAGAVDAPEFTEEESTVLAQMETEPARRVPDSRGRILATLLKWKADGKDGTGEGVFGFRMPVINHEKCQGCGLCPAVCPTGALSVEKTEGGMSIRCAPSRCTACGLCGDICFPGAITIAPLPDGVSLLSSGLVELTATHSGGGMLDVWGDKLERMFDAPVYRT